jgi:hypothetical protein
MGMPEIELEPISREDALAAILGSIALQEAAMAHIMNADGEKLQRAINLADPEVMQGTGGPSMTPAGLKYTGAGTGPTDIGLLDVNENVGDMLDNSREFELALRDKMNGVLKFFNADEALDADTCIVNVGITGPALAGSATLAGSAVVFSGRVQIAGSTPPQYQLIQRTATVNALGVGAVNLPAGTSIDYSAQMANAPEGYIADPAVQFLTGVGGPTFTCPASITFNYITAPAAP